MTLRPDLYPDPGTRRISVLLGPILRGLPVILAFTALGAVTATGVTLLLGTPRLSCGRIQVQAVIVQDVKADIPVRRVVQMDDELTLLEDQAVPKDRAGQVTATVDANGQVIRVCTRARTDDVRAVTDGVMERYRSTRDRREQQEMRFRLAAFDARIATLGAQRQQLLRDAPTGAGTDPEPYQEAVTLMDDRIAALEVVRRLTEVVPTDGVRVVNAASAARTDVALLRRIAASGAGIGFLVGVQVVRFRSRRRIGVL